MTLALVLFALFCLLVADIVAYGEVMNRFIARHPSRLDGLEAWLDSDIRSIAQIPMFSLVLYLLNPLTLRRE